MNDDELYHYGVLGMKWGVRRAKQSGNSASLKRHFGNTAGKLDDLESKAAKQALKADDQRIASETAATPRDRSNLRKSSTKNMRKALRGYNKTVKFAAAAVNSFWDAPVDTITEDNKKEIADHLNRSAFMQKRLTDELNMQQIMSEMSDVPRTTYHVVHA